MAIYLTDSSSIELDAQIIEINVNDLSATGEDWYFDWRKIDFEDSKIFKIVLKNDNSIQGLVAFGLGNGEMPYLRLIEVAPHNYGKNGKYDRVAGCLIAKCCQLAYTETINPMWKGFLTFIPVNETVGNIYKEKYGATGEPVGYMSFSREKSKMLIEEYLT